MITNIMNLIKQISWRCISQSEIRKIAAAKKEAAKARAGKNSFPPTPFLFARPSGKVLIKIQSPDFRQKMFEHQSKNTAKNHISKNQGWLPRRKAPRHGIFPQFERHF